MGDRLNRKTIEVGAGLAPALFLLQKRKGSKEEGRGKPYPYREAEN